MANHLIIGLGGTGGKIIREFRKRYFEEFNTLDPQNKVYVEYLYVDSSEADLNDRSGWKVMGTSVALSPSQKVSTHGIKMSMLHNLEQYPSLKAMLDSRDVDTMERKVGGLISDGKGGQRRRLGRILLANNLVSQNSFTNRLKDAERRLTNSSEDQDIHFHVCAGLAGGTGSGSLIDVIAQIRKLYPQRDGNKSYRLHLYLYVPENTVANSSHDSGYYQANGYASLLELNAMSIGSYTPLDMSGEKDADTQNVKRLKSSNAFEAAFLFSNTNEKGRVLNLGQTLPAMVGDFLFHKIVTSGINGSAGQMARLESQENEGGDPECNQAGEAVRSRKFLSFGIHRIEFPETEIEEYITYKFANQAALQIIGFGEASTNDIGLNMETLVKSREEREKLKISNVLLMLSRPIEENETTKFWRDFESSWDALVKRVTGKTTTEYEKDAWLPTLTKEMEEYFNNGFRTHGVKGFYQIQTNEINKYARLIRRHIEDLLFADWLSGNRSILEIQEYIRLLIQDSIERVSGFDKQKSKVESQLDSLREKQKEAMVKYNKTRTSLMGKLSGNAGTRFAEYGAAAKSVYVALTQIEALSFARLLMQRVVSELQFMDKDILDFKHKLDEFHKNLSSKCDTRCRIDDNDNGKSTKKYDRDCVIETTAQSIRNKQLQQSNAMGVRNAIASLLGDDSSKTFANLAAFDMNSCEDAILGICQRNAVDVMNNTATQEPQNKMRGVNILEKLRDEYNTDEKLRQFAEDTVRSAVTFLQFDGEEEAKVFGRSATATTSRMIQLSIPMLENDKDGFRQRLIKAFQGACDFSFSEAEDVSVNPKSNQMVIVAARSGFPLRFISNVKVLKDAYDKLIADPQEGALNKLLLHTETFTKELPPLYEPTASEIAKVIAPTVMLGFAMGLFKEDTDKKTESKFIYLPVLGEYDDIEKIRLGASFNDVIKYLSTHYDTAKVVEREVENTLAKDYVANSDKQTLRQELNKLLGGTILESCGDDEYTDEYGFYRTCRNNLFDNELKLS